MFRPAPPWPPWFVHIHSSPMLWSITLWLVELLGGGGLTLALLAVRQGWQPRPQRLIIGAVVAVVALMVTPPVNSGDPLYYAAYGRIAALGHDPYVMNPIQLMPSADPVRAAVPFQQEDPPSRYGPVATVTEAAASELSGTSVARTVFWLKVWNALAYLALVLALDRAVRSSPSRRVRAHLLWSLNPLMLLAVLANAHNDVLAVAAGASALFAFRRANSRWGLLAGVLLGLATAIKAPYALFGAGLTWAARRSLRTLAALALGAAAVLVPSYLLAGRAAISATTTGMGSSVPPTFLWEDVARVLGWQYAISRVNTLGMIGCAALALILLWRMPHGPREFPAVRVALALGLGLLVVAPLQTFSLDAMIFPLLAVFSASRLDWVVIARNTALAAASAPFISPLDPAWLTAIERISIGWSPVLAVAAIDVSLLWLCATRAWNSTTSHRDLSITPAFAEFGGVQSPAS